MVYIEVINMAGPRLIQAIKNMYYTTNHHHHHHHIYMYIGLTTLDLTFDDVCTCALSDTDVTCLRD